MCNSCLTLVSISELWAPKEIALFSTCICSFGKRFEVFTDYVSNSQVHH